MTKRFLTMLALAFALQLSWGVVSAYCMHESGKASQHFGHHQHKHTDTVAAADEGNTQAPKKSVVHLDCATCSHVTPASFAGDVALLTAPLFSHQPSAAVPAQAAPYLGLPERPQWFVAA